MLSDDQILEKGGTQEDIANYAHDVGNACGALYGGTCDQCGETDYYYPVILRINEILKKINKEDESDLQDFLYAASEITSYDSKNYNDAISEAFNAIDKYDLSKKFYAQSPEFYKLAINILK